MAASPQGDAGLVDSRVRYGAPQKDRFDRDGFILLPRFLSQEGLAHLRERVDAIYREKAPGVDGEWITNLHQLLPPEDNWMWALATHPVVIRMVELSLGPDAQIYASQLHRKGPATSADRGGHAVPAHQDGDARVRTIWITLDHVDQDNGALEVLPGGHHLGRLPLRLVESLEELEAAQYFARNVMLVMRAFAPLFAHNVMPVMCALAPPYACLCHRLHLSSSFLLVSRGGPVTCQGGCVISLCCPARG